MNKEEALEFLEISSQASPGEMEKAWQQRYNFFKLLHSNAPNDMLRLVQEKNLARLDEIKILLRLTGSGTESKPSLAPGPELRQVEVHESAATVDSEESSLAYLVVHTEDRPMRSFPLAEGLNVVGRVKIPGVHSIAVEEDSYVSRLHCQFIITCKNNLWCCDLVDDGSLNQGKPSKNGTFVNGNTQRINRQALKDYDTVQVGMTKLVFRWKKKRTTGELEDQVRHTDFKQTVFINI